MTAALSICLLKCDFFPHIILSVCCVCALEVTSRWNEHDLRCPPESKCSSCWFRAQLPMEFEAEWSHRAPGAGRGSAISLKHAWRSKALNRDCLFLDAAWPWAGITSGNFLQKRKSHRYLSRFQKWSEVTSNDCWVTSDCILEWFMVICLSKGI